MIAFTIFAMALYIVGLFCLIMIGGRDLRSPKPGPRSSRPPGWPSACVIVPAAGAAPELARSVRSLLAQDYPEYRIVFVTRDPEDPAGSIIKKEIEAGSRASLVHSGRTTACSQKNCNLLRGLRDIADKPEVLVFCDSTRIAGPDWLKNLVGPVARGEALVTSGYHHVIAEGHRIAALGRACSVLLLFLTKGIAGLNQPWGGATAIRRQTFEALEVERLWSQNVVDDVSLAACLKKRGIQTASSPLAILSTHVNAETWKSWDLWLVRQWLYLKFCLPGSWLAAGVLCYSGAVLVILSLLLCALGIAGLIAPAPAIGSVLFLALLTGPGWLLRRHHPSPGPALSWFAAFFATLVMAGWSHMETLFMKHIVWKGIRYEVAWGGNVTDIRDAG